MTNYILLSGGQMRTAEAATIAGGVASAALMEAAGERAAQIIIKAWAQRPVHIVCGPGNNGGDGYVVARYLKEAGWPVRVASIVDPGSLKGDAKLMTGLFDGAIEQASADFFHEAGLIVDALFGTGLSRPLVGDVADIINVINSSPAPVLSIDLPSGIHADRGAVMGTAVQAARTVTFFHKKPGHALMPGRLYCGIVDIVDIGIAEQTMDRVGVNTAENHPAMWGRAFTRPMPMQHKYDRGHVFVVSGKAHRTGAARLAAHAALRSGAGLVTVLSPSDALSVNAHHLTSIMVEPADKSVDITEALARKDQYVRVAIIGPACGVSDFTREKVISILRTSARAVIDADALTSVAGDIEPFLDALSEYDVLTPHEGEFRRVFPEADLTRGKLTAVRMAAERAGCCVLLKGADTVIAAPDGRASINVNAPPDLAIAGSGDVLAGLIGGYLAQGMPAFEAASAGVWVHGACGQLAGPGLIAEDLADQVPNVLRSLVSQGTEPTTGAPPLANSPDPHSAGSGV